MTNHMIRLQFTKRHGVRTQKTWIFNTTAERTGNLYSRIQAEIGSVTQRTSTPMATLISFRDR
jgi:hypothetical protein